MSITMDGCHATMVRLQPDRPEQEPVLKVQII